LPRREAAKASALRVEALPTASLDRIREALTGPGGPAGILSAEIDGSCLLVSYDAARTPPALISAVIAAEVASSPGMHGAGELPRDDAALATFCSRVLQEPDLDTSRLIETYIEPMLIEKP